MMAIERTVQIPVTATLMLKPEYGKERPATMEDLMDMGFLFKEDLYERTCYMFALIGLDIDSDEDNVSILRYFIEYITQGYTWDPDQVDIDRMRLSFGGG